MIPRVIHSIWLGGEMPDSIEQVCKNNKKILSNFDYKIWRNKDIPKEIPFTIKKALKKKIWAFVSDYMRFYLLERHGGVYLDSDMIVLRNLTPFLKENCFAGINQENNTVYCGIIGAKPRSRLIQETLQFYSKTKKSFFTSPQIFTEVIEKSSEKNISVYHSNIFYPKKIGHPCSYTFHRYDESWRRFVPLRRILRKYNMIKIYHSLLRKNKPRRFSFPIIDKSQLK